MQLKNLPTLTLHELSAAQYKREYEAGRIDEDALYLTPDAALIVTLDEENGTASHTSQEICEHIQSNGVVYAFNGYEYYQVSCVTNHIAWFSYVGDDFVIYYITVYEDGSYEVGDQQLAPSNSYTLLVYTHAVNGNLYADWSPTQIRGHIDSGGTVMFVNTLGDYISLVESTHTYAVFEKRSDDGSVFHYEIDHEGRITETMLALTTIQDVEAKIAEEISNLPTYEGTYREIYGGEVEDV